MSRNSKPPPLGGGAFTPEIPTNAEDNYFPIEMTAFEKFINAQHIGHLGRVVEGNMARLRRLHQNHATAEAYTSYTGQYSAAGKPQPAAFSDGMTETWTYSSDGTLSKTVEDCIPGKSYVDLEKTMTPPATWKIPLRRIALVRMSRAFMK